MDAVWSDRPGEPLGAVETYPESFAGESSAGKRARMAQQLADEKLDALVVSAADSLAWLLNIRGRDLETTPFALGRALLRASGALTLFMHPRKLGPEVRAYLAAQSALTLRLVLAIFGLVVFLAGAGFAWWADEDVMLVVCGVLALVAAIDIVVVVRRKARGEPG